MKTTININEATIKNFIESIRPEDLEIRKQVDMGYSFDEKTAILYEIRPSFMEEGAIDHIEFAKIRFYKSTSKWKLYWMRSNEKWHQYQPFPESTHLDEIINIIKKDEHGCFFG